MNFYSKTKLIELKIKSKHLALEPSIIRKEEKKALDNMRFHRYRMEVVEEDRYRDRYDNFYHHRVYDVKKEARATYLAIAFLKGKAYKKVESKSYGVDVDIKNRVVAMVVKYGYMEHGRDRAAIASKIEEWLTV